MQLYDKAWAILNHAKRTLLKNTLNIYLDDELRITI